MQPFDLEILLKPGVVIFFVTLWVTYGMTRSPSFSLLAAFIKAGIFFFYFGILFDGSFTALDDFIYLEGGRRLYVQGVGITNLVESWDLMLMVGAGQHIAYYLYNSYSFHFFGMGYYAPVAMNIVLSTLLAWLGTCLAVKEFKFNKIEKNSFFAFMLFHPDILIWSSIFNAKDILVLLLHIVTLFSVSLLFRRCYMSSIAIFVAVAFLLFSLRFYVPILFAVALFASLLSFRVWKKHLELLLIGGLFFSLAFLWHEPDILQYALISLREHFVNPLYGFIRFVLTPIPFNTEEAYSFLDLPAFIHWLLLPFACWGIFVVHRLRTSFSRFFLFYVFVFVCLYSVYGELQGPRHRVQLDYAWATFQFMGLMSAIRFVLLRCQEAKMRNAAAGQPTLSTCQISPSN